jgi:hypothetical protein
MEAANNASRAMNVPARRTLERKNREQNRVFSNNYPLGFAHVQPMNGDTLKRSVRST